MTNEERTREQQQPGNVRLFIPRTVDSTPKSNGAAQLGRRELSRGRDIVNNDDDPGPSAA